MQPHRRDNLFETVHDLHATRGAFSAEARPQAVMLPAQATRAGAVALGALSCLSAGFVLGLTVRRH